MLTIPTVFGIISLLTVIGLLVIIIISYKEIMGTFQTTIIDKKLTNNVIYSGIFLPIFYYILVVDMGIEIRVNKFQYDNINIGDSIRVERYSNGSYQLESI